MVLKEKSISRIDTGRDVGGISTAEKDLSGVVHFQQT